jgi:hypothetical protein
MDEQFDKKLTNHIKGVFDNYEHPGAEHGWEQLRKKLPAEQKSNKIAWLWWSSAAAVIVVFLGIGLWYYNQDSAVNNMAVKPAVKQQQQPIIKDTAVINNTTIPDKTAPVIANNNGASTNRTTMPAYVNRATATSRFNIVTTTSALQPNTLAGHPQPGFNQAQINPLAQTNSAVAASVKPHIDSQKVINNAVTQPQLAAAQQLADNSSATQAPTTTPPISITKKQATLADMLAENSSATTAKKNSADKQADKKVNFSVYAATYFNYAEGSSNQINAGAGFTSDFKLSKKLKLSTGVALAQNSLNYTGGPPQAANNLVAAAPALKQETFFATSAVLPVFKNYNASLVGLDIPINIKYEFNPDKTDAYVSAGLSSGTFIDESYTYRYGYGNGATANDNAAQQQTAHNSFNNFYFGKMLNLSFGLGYPVGGNRLIVEPFVKYPLGGLGAQDIRFGSGGVNLKFSFRGGK